MILFGVESMIRSDIIRIANQNIYRNKSG